MVVPFPAGGTADLLCRYAAEKASAVLGQQVVIENRPGGAGGRVGMEQVLRAPPDGYTLLCIDATQLQHHASGVLEGELRPAPARADQRARDLSADHLDARKDLPANNLKGFIDYAKAAARSATATRAWPTPVICSVR